MGLFALHVSCPHLLKDKFAVKPRPKVQSKPLSFNVLGTMLALSSSTSRLANTFLGHPGQQSEHGRVAWGRRCSSGEVVPGVYQTVLLYYMLYIYWTFLFYSSFLLFSFRMHNTGKVALEYTWVKDADSEEVKKLYSTTVMRKDISLGG